MRLDKFVCKSTEYLKAEAVELIRGGALFVNGESVTHEAHQVHENNEITLHGVELTPRPFRYLMLHKRAGTECSNVDGVYPSLFNDLKIEHVEELHVAGRLDADTTGLVLITDDGRWTFDIITPQKNCPKVYRVGLSRDLSEELVEKFKNGIQLQGEAELTRPAQLEIVSPREALLTITEGKFHQVKRMFRAVGNKVISLHRESIGEVKLDVELGEWRYLNDEEVQSFLEEKNKRV